MAEMLARDSSDRRPAPDIAGEAPTPQAGAVDLSDPETFVSGVPHEAFGKLRRTEPVSWQDELEGTGFWSLTKYADVHACSRNHRVFSSGRKGCFMFDSPPEDLERMQLMMVNMDPPRHTKLRAIVNKGFTPVRMRAIEHHVREVCKQIIDNVAGRGECDFVTHVAAELPLQVIAELLGVPLEERQKVFDWSNRLIGFDDPEFQTSMEDGKIAAAELYVYANQLAADRRDDQKDDLTSILMNAEVEGEKLSELEFDLFFLLLAVAGNETTRNALSHGMHTLIDHPDQYRMLSENPSLVPSATEEILRWASPVMYFRRNVMRDTEVGGQQIKAGDKVGIWYISANRDESVFENPFTFDIKRTPNEHVAFGGGGPHFCLGANLARMEMNIMFDELVRRVDSVELVGDVKRLRSNFINGIKHLPVRLHRAKKDAAA